MHQYVKTSNKYMKSFDKDKKSSYLKYWEVNNLYCCAMSQKLPVTGYKWIENISEFDEGFMESYNKKSKKGYIFEVDAEYTKLMLKFYMSSIMIYPFCQTE